MITCRTAAGLVSRGADAGTGPLARVGLHAHLLLCPACRRFRAQVAAVGEAVRGYLADPPPARLSAAAAARIAAAVRAELGDARPPAG